MNEPHTAPTTPTNVALRRNGAWCVIQFFFWILCSSWLRLRTRGQEGLPTGPALLVCNHQSFLDPLLAAVALRRPVCYLARQSLFRVPVIGWILRNTFVIPIRTEGGGSQAVREMCQRLEEGFYAGIFPEGTRSLTGQMGPVKPGAIMVLKRQPVTVVPVGIAGAYQALPYGAWFLRPTRIRVVYGSPITADEVKALLLSSDSSALLKEIEVRLRSAWERAEAWRNETSS